MVLQCNHAQPPYAGGADTKLDPQRRALRSPALDKLELDDLDIPPDGIRAVEDLARSFPALLFALKTGYATPERRRTCLQAVVAGARLKETAQLLGLPFWMRRLPPEALVGPLPVLPDDRDFALAVVPALPKSAEAVLPWLDFLSLADRIADREVSLWFARNPRLAPPSAQMAEALWILAWAFYGKLPDSLAGRIQRRSWSPRIGARLAREETANWRKRIEGLLALGSGFPDTWFADGSAMGYEFVALRTPEDLFSECAAMRNCLDLYALRLGHMRSRLFSVRVKGKPIATLELGLRNDEVGVPFIVQLRGIGNRRAGPLVWQAVHAWMGCQSFAHLDRTPRPKRMSLVLRRQIWAPLTEVAAVHGVVERFEPLTLGRIPAPKRKGTSAF
jgi:hypothetical protein